MRLAVISRRGSVHNAGLLLAQISNDQLRYPLCAVLVGSRGDLMPLPETERVGTGHAKSLGGVERKFYEKAYRRIQGSQYSALALSESSTHQVGV
jgi:hypothetical protein